MSLLLINANSLRIPLADKSVHCVATSPPYWGLRDYGTAKWEGGDPECDHAAAQIRTGMGLAALGEKYRGGGHKQGKIQYIQFRGECQKCGAARLDGQLGLEPLHDCGGWVTGEECGRCYVCHMVQVFRELWRVLRDDGIVWLNLGDSYASGEIGRNDSIQQRAIGGKPVTSKAKQRQIRARPQTIKQKNLIGIPWRVALALQADGWILRSDVIWSKPNPMPESVTDRPTRGHEYIFLLTKSEKYYYDHIAVKEPAEESSIKRISQPSFDSQLGGDKDYRNGVNENRSVRRTLENFRESAMSEGKRRSRDSFRRDGNKRENIPGQRLGMHRPDRDESNWDLTTRNRRTVWTVSTKPYKGSHFATWPPDLVEPMIKAGTSEAGCCPECGAPWRRIISKSDPRPRPDNPNPVLPYTADSNHRQGIDGSTLHMTRETMTLGWEPGCKCQNAAALTPVPCVVLDPFAGSGTTLMVARQLGRHGIGLDLSLDYLRNEARTRLSFDQLDRWNEGEARTDTKDYTSLPLFVGAIQ